ncbi:unnamed protein product [Danaus chrysippus]|uniref:(African queen) hypothetical protein n=1 Tax=Danaus chrysippus TaxID=151541 RepID=A0A8J2RAX3_9NEOP|nr:unnamed protein product [Danaus chrysippus]
MWNKEGLQRLSVVIPPPLALGPRPPAFAPGGQTRWVSRATPPPGGLRALIAPQNWDDIILYSMEILFGVTLFKYIQYPWSCHTHAAPPTLTHPLKLASPENRLEIRL